MRKHGTEDICFWCRQRILWERSDPRYKGQWETEDGDSGCDLNPASNEEGVDRHYTEKEVRNTFAALTTFIDTISR